VPQPSATVDTSVLVSLQSAELLAAVSVLFNRLLVPARVREELKEGGERNRSALNAIEDFAIFERCDDYDRTLVKLLLDTRKHLKKRKDEGEAEAVIQGAQRSVAMVLTDDLLGREWASNHSLEHHGSIWICHELRRLGFLTHLRPYYVQMLKRGRRQPLRDMNNYLRYFGEPPITKQQYREYTSRLPS